MTSQRLERKRAQRSRSVKHYHPSFWLQEAEEMLQFSSVRIKPNSSQALAIAILERIPLISGLLKSLNGTGLSLSRLVLLEGIEEASVASSGFRIAGVVFAFIDFIRIPLLYLAAWLLDLEPPITLSNNAKWAYSAVIFGLAAAGLAVPTLIPIFSLVTAAIVFSASVFFLAKHYYDQIQVKKDLRKTNLKMDETREELRIIFSSLRTLVKKLKDPSENEKHLFYSYQVEELQEEFLIKKQEIKELYQMQNDQQQFANSLNSDSAKEKMFVLALAGLGLVGFTVALFFPPAGIAIVSTSAAIGALYMLCKIVGCLSKRKIPSAETKEIPLELWDSPSRMNQSLGLKQSFESIEESKPLFKGRYDQFRFLGKNSSIKEVEICEDLPGSFLMEDTGGYTFET